MKAHVAWVFVVGLLLLSIESNAYAGGHHKAWKDTSNIGAAILTLSSLAVPTAKGDWQGLGEAAWSDGLGEGISLAWQIGDSRGTPQPSEQ